MTRHQDGDYGQGFGGDTRPVVLATATQGLRETELRPPPDVLRGAAGDWDEAGGGGAKGSVFASLVAQVFEARFQSHYGPACGYRCSQAAGARYGPACVAGVHMQERPCTAQAMGFELGRAEKVGLLAMMLLPSPPACGAELKGAILHASPLFCPFTSTPASAG